MVRAEGLRPLAARTGIPVGQIRSLIDGRAVRVTTLELMTSVLGVPLTIGPSPGGDRSPAPPVRGHTPPDHSSTVFSKVGAAPSQGDGSHFPAQLRDGAGLVRDLADRVAGAAHSLLRLLSGWDPAKDARILVHAEGAPCSGSPVMIPFASSVRVSEGGLESVFEPSPEVTLAIAPDALPDWAGTDRLVCVRAADETMDTTIRRGGLVVFDRGHRAPQDDQLFALATETGLVIRRLRYRDHWIVSTDTAAHGDRPLSGDDRILGQVVWQGPRERDPSDDA